MKAKIVKRTGRPETLLTLVWVLVIDGREKGYFQTAGRAEEAAKKLFGATEIEYATRDKDGIDHDGAYGAFAQ